MKNPLALACIISAFGFCSSAQTSDSLSGPRVWLNADRSQLTANAWTDLSLFKRDATSPTAATLPSPSGSINFNPALSFDGIDDYLQIPYSLDGLSELSVLAVFQSTDTTERGIWGSEESMRKVLLTTRRAIGPDSIADEYGRNEHTTVLNTVVQTWDDAGVTVATTGSIALGSAGKARSYKPFKGALAELLIFNRALSFLERVQYETYLALKYGTGLRGGNFVSSGEKVLWHVAQNTAYGYNIAGIGRDDFFKLYQKQSGSAYDSGLLLINAGKLAESNQRNAGTINNQDFSYLQETFDPVYSAFSYEDLPSDKFGADFGANYFDPNSDLTFGEQLANYLNNVLGATNPEEAPNFKDLPEKESKGKPTATNRATKAMFVKEEEK